MKSVRFCFGFLLLLITGFCYSQSLQRQDTINMICREWKFKEAYSDNLDRHSEEMKDFITDTRFLFKSNTTFIYKDAGYEQVGKWNYSSLRKEITIEMPDGTKIILKIMSLSSSIIKFESKNPETNTFSSGTLIPAM
jgi:hypothetical protein